MNLDEQKIARAGLKFFCWALGTAAIFALGYFGGRALWS